MNLGTQEEPQMVEVNSNLQPKKARKLEQLFKEYKDVFAWTYKDLKGIPPKLVYIQIKLNPTIPLAH